jgi:hypothetical protein
MSVLDKLKRDRLSAELVSVERMLATLTDDDVFMRLDLEERRNELKAWSEQVSRDPETAASVALFFGGRPVVAALGIEAEFGGSAVTKFQDLLAKIMMQEFPLGQRGPVPKKGAATMHITNIVRGSFGFLMQEMQPQGALIGTNLSSAVESATRLMVALGAPSELDFQDIASDMDQRTLTTAAEFFGLLRQNDATFRIVASGQDRSFTRADIAAALDRAGKTVVDEFDQDLPGQLSGTLPEAHTFEFRSYTGDLYNGKVVKSLTADVLAQWNSTHIGLSASAKIRTRVVRKDGAPVRYSYTLLGLSEPDEAVVKINQEN